jgi:hypothetical protein|nr:MAG TPA: Pulmonary surfactant-associated protein D, c-type lectin, alpha-helical coiled [Caudoviricetes sp.]
MAKFLLGNLKGPKGDKGDPGPRGPQGIQGPPGTAENIDLTPFVKKTENTTLTGQYTFTNNTPIKLNGYNVVSENNRILFKNADNKNVFAFDADAITHNDKSLLTQDKANTLYAPIGDYALRTALNSYATTASLSNYLTTSNASTTYLNKTDAASTYAKKTDLSGYAASSTLSNYVTTANANNTYLSKTDANTIYAKKTDIGNALTLTQANDAYVSKAGDNNVTGTINISKTAGLTLANHIFESNPTNLVIKNKANQPILTVYPSVAYLNGREVLNQFKADQLYAPKNALSNYVTTSQYNNDMNSLLTALRNVNN